MKTAIEMIESAERSAKANMGGGFHEQWDYAEEVRALRIFLEETAAERDALRAEVEALRADAERYRWLRSDDIETHPGQREIYVLMERAPFAEGQRDEVLTESALDAAIDAARAEAKP